MTPEERRGARKCGTCWWFAKWGKDNSHLPKDGACSIRFPYGGFQGQLQSHEVTKSAENDWCSFWSPNLATM